PELVLGDLAERLACLHGVRPHLPRGRRWRGNHGDVGDHFLLPIGDRLDRIPDLVLLGVRRDGALEVELAVALLRVAVEHALARLDRVNVLITQSHHSPLLPFVLEHRYPGRSPFAVRTAARECVNRATVMWTSFCFLPSWRNDALSSRNRR